MRNTNALTIALFLVACGPTQSDLLVGEESSDARAPDTSFANDAAAVPDASVPRITTAKTNVLLIVLDDVGRDDIGTYQPAGTVSRTPNIDLLAADGVRFSQAWTNPVCSPTRASVMTGRHAFRHLIGAPIMAGDPELETSEVTIPDFLRDAGYTTGLFGKWHLGDSVDDGCQPATHGGFDHFAGSLGGGVADFYSWSKTEADGADACSSASSGLETGYVTTDTADDAATWIADQAAAGKPFLAMVAFNAPHTPWHVPPADLHSDRTLDTVSSTYCTSTSGDRNCFLAMLEAADTEIGNLLSNVEGIDSGATLDNTLIIVLGDNGNDSRVVPAGVDSTRSKDTVYQAGVTAPLIVSGKGVVSAGREVTALVNSLDIFATIADAADVDLSTEIPAATAIDSVSLTPYLESATATAQKRTILTETFTGGDPANGDVAIRSLTYKLIVKEDGTEELYNLGTDPTELIDLNDGSLTSVQTRNLSALRAALAAYGR